MDFTYTLYAAPAMRTSQRLSMLMDELRTRYQGIPLVPAIALVDVVGDQATLKQCMEHTAKELSPRDIIYTAVQSDDTRGTYLSLALTDPLLEVQEAACAHFRHVQKQIHPLHFPLLFPQVAKKEQISVHLELMGKVRRIAPEQSLRLDFLELYMHFGEKRTIVTRRAL